MKGKLSNRIATPVIVAFIALLSSCVRTVPTPPPGVQTGLASWYGMDFHGKLTSNKEVYDMYDMTAAHKTLPFGTYVMVTNLNNGKSAVVRINDRGPFVKGRVIDLSYAAAKMLDLVGPGVAPVRIEVLRNFSTMTSLPEYSIQIGAFIVEKNAAALKKKLQKSHKNVYISLYRTPIQTYFRVRIKAQSQEEARQIARQLLKEGYTPLVLEEQ